jgi:hypothetical protein
MTEIENALFGVSPRIETKWIDSDPGFCGDEAWQGR